MARTVNVVLEVDDRGSAKIRQFARDLEVSSHTAEAGLSGLHRQIGVTGKNVDRLIAAGRPAVERMAQLGGSARAAIAPVADLGIGIGSMAAGFGLATVAADLAGRAAFAFGSFVGGSVREALKADEAVNELRASLEGAGSSWKQAGGPVLAYLSAIQRVSRFSDEELGAALTQLITITGNARTGVSGLAAVVDTAAARSKPLQTITEQISLAVAGNFRALRTLLPALDEHTKKLIRQADEGERARIIFEALADAYGGRALEATKSLAGSLAVLSNQWNDVQEKTGFAILQLGNAIVPLGELSQMVAEINAELASGQPNWNKWIAATVALLSSNPQGGLQIPAQLRAAVLAFNAFGSAAVDNAKLAKDAINSVADVGPSIEDMASHIAERTGFKLLSEETDRLNRSLEDLHRLQAAGIPIVGGYGAAYHIVREQLEALTGPSKEVVSDLNRHLSSVGVASKRMVEEFTRRVELLLEAAKAKGAPAGLVMASLAKDIEEVGRSAHIAGTSTPELERLLSAIPKKIPPIKFDIENVAGSLGPLGSFLEGIEEPIEIEIVPPGEEARQALLELRSSLAQAGLMTQTMADIWLDKWQQMGEAASRDGADIGQILMATTDDLLAFARAAERSGIDLPEAMDAWIDKAREWEHSFSHIGGLLVDKAREFVDTVGTKWAELFESTISGFSQLVGEAVLGIRSFGDAAMQFLKQLASRAVALLVEWLIQKLIVDKASTISGASQYAGMLAGALALVFANTWASTAAAPIVGPALAPAAAAAATAAAATGAAAAGAVGAALGSGIVIGGAGGTGFMAEGGIVTRPTRAIIGERGREGIFPLEGPEGRRAARALGLGGGAPITVNVTINGDNWSPGRLPVEIRDTVYRAVSDGIRKGQLLALPTGAR